MLNDRPAQSCHPQSAASTNSAVRSNPLLTIVVGLVWFVGWLVVELLSAASTNSVVRLNRLLALVVWLLSLTSGQHHQLPISPGGVVAIAEVSHIVLQYSSSTTILMCNHD